MQYSCRVHSSCTTTCMAIYSTQLLLWCCYHPLLLCITVIIIISCVVITTSIMIIKAPFYQILQSITIRFTKYNYMIISTIIFTGTTILSLQFWTPQGGETAEVSDVYGSDVCEHPEIKAAQAEVDPLQHKQCQLKSGVHETVHDPSFLAYGAVTPSPSLPHIPCESSSLCVCVSLSVCLCISVSLCLCKSVSLSLHICVSVPLCLSLSACLFLFASFFLSFSVCLQCYWNATSGKFVNLAIFFILMLRK